MGAHGATGWPAGGWVVDRKAGPAWSGRVGRHALSKPCRQPPPSSPPLPTPAHPCPPCLPCPPCPLPAAAQEAVRLCRKVLGPTSPTSIQTSNILGICIQNQGKWGEAAEYWRGVVSEREALLGAEHVHTLQAMANLKAVLDHLDQLLEGEGRDSFWDEEAEEAAGEEGRRGSRASGSRPGGGQGEGG